MVSIAGKKEFLSGLVRDQAHPKFSFARSQFA